MATALWNIFIGFLRSTLLGFGGGPSIVPLYENEVVNVFKWLTKDEFGQTLAFANALPGPIATKLSMYVGYKVAGWAGAFTALAAVTLPTGLAVIGLFSLLGTFKDSPYFKGMITGIRPVVFVMLALLAWDFARYAFEPYGSGYLRWLPLGIAAAYFVSVQYFHLSPIWGVVASLVAGALLFR
jgi:chromate transporter